MDMDMADKIIQCA